MQLCLCVDNTLDQMILLAEEIVQPLKFAQMWRFCLQNDLKSMRTSDYHELTYVSRS